MAIRIDGRFDPIKRRIQSICPKADISVVDSIKDDVGGVLFVKNGTSEIIDKIGISMDYVMIALDDKHATDIIVVPIPQNVSEMRRENFSVAE
ncbi:MAG TPA: hypothetical protein PLQ76_03265 [bacterium]|nr:hypothetical protein [bacterium]